MPQRLPAPELDAVKATEHVAQLMIAFLNDRLDSFGDGD
jgi:hypothetical protein